MVISKGLSWEEVIQVSVRGLCCLLLHPILLVMTMVVLEFYIWGRWCFLKDTSTGHTHSFHLKLKLSSSSKWPLLESQTNKTENDLEVIVELNKIYRSIVLESIKGQSLSKKGRKPLEYLLIFSVISIPHWWQVLWSWWQNKGDICEVHQRWHYVEITIYVCLWECDGLVEWCKMLKLSLGQIEVQYVWLYLVCAHTYTQRWDCFQVTLWQTDIFPACRNYSEALSAGIFSPIFQKRKLRLQDVKFVV